jgi:NitT/TauT family transport system substrate-binding protein
VKMLRSRLVHTIAAAAIVALAASACGTQETRRDRISVRFPIPIVEAGQTPFYVAADNGYYDAENLDVQFAMGSPELNPVKMVVSGTDEIGVIGGPDTLIVARAAGQPVKAVAVLHRNANFSVLLTLKDSGLTKLQDLQDKRIGFFHGHISTDVLHSVLHKERIRYEEVDTGFNYTPLITKQVDAEWAFRVTAGLDLPAKGVAVNVINPADYGVTSHGYTIFVTDTTAATRAEVITRFLRATLKGVRYTVDHPRESNELLVKRDKSLDRELSLKRLEMYNEVTSSSDQFPPGYLDEDMFRSTYDRLAAEKVLANPFDPKEVFTTSFLEQIHANFKRK